MKTLAILFLYIALTYGKPRSSRIIGGQVARAGEFPYAAAITKRTSDGNFFCTGSILSNDWVITAGQCVTDAILFEITIGTNVLSRDDPTSQKLSTDTWVAHPDFDPLTLANDIGLIQFREPIMYTNYIHNLYLPYQDLDNWPNGIATGWGQTSDSISEISDSLNFVQLTMVTDVECRLTYGSNIPENIKCFEGSFNEGTCYGDSGSPLIQHVSINNLQILAVSSFFSGRGCESTDPSGFTSVFPYNDWIKNITGVQYP